MPELPEVETTKRGIEPHVIKKKINSIYIGKHNLRIKFNKNQKNNILNTKIAGVRRKAKNLVRTVEKNLRRDFGPGLEENN